MSLKSLLHVVLLFFIPPLVTAAVSDNGSSETLLTAEPGDIALLPCYTDGTVTPNLTVWTKNGQEIVRGGGSPLSPSPAGQRLTVEHDGSLNIRGVIRGDEGIYLCTSTLPGSNTFRARVLLNVTSK